MTGINKVFTVINSTFKVTIKGVNNKIQIKSSIHYLIILGTNNTIFGTDPNCVVDILNIDGHNNKIMLNRQCSNVTINDKGANNKVSFVWGLQNNISNYYENLNLLSKQWK